MGIFDFLKTEKRESQPFTEPIQAAIFEQASGSAPLDAKAIGALEVAAGFWARAFASANITPQNPLTLSLTPSILAIIGRSYAAGEKRFLRLWFRPRARFAWFPRDSGIFEGEPIRIHGFTGWIFSELHAIGLNTYRGPACFTSDMPLILLIPGLVCRRFNTPGIQEN